ncbi:hypothetical protein AHAS_Ahas11G0046000 [Arachis hypogaea]
MSIIHLYQSLCRTTCFYCKDIDDPLFLLHIWAWEQMPLLALIFQSPRFPLACP